MGDSIRIPHFFYMIISPYIRFFNVKGRYFIYNMLTKAILEIDNALFKTMTTNSHSNIKWPDVLSAKNFDLLYLKEFIVDSKEDAVKNCLDYIEWNRNRQDFLHLTLLPTLDCCCSCYYCFEKNRQSLYMEENVVDSIIEFIKRKQGLERLHITWFGGEPLMGKNIIKYFYKQLSSFFEGIYSSDIITNGIFLNDEAIDLISECQISEIQISLDGLKDTHNKIKKCDVTDDVYEKTLSNVERLVQKLHDVNVNLRVNFSKDTIDDFVESYRMLSNRFNYERIFVSPGFLVNKNSSTCAEGRSCTFFNLQDKYVCSLKLWEDYGIPTGRIISNDYTLECAIRSNASIVIGPEGSIYRCWEHVGAKSNEIGYIASNGIILNKETSNKIEHLLNRTDPLKLSICKQCEYLPLCYGGCPIERDKRIDISHCILNTGYFEELLKAHLEFLIQCRMI